MARKYRTVSTKGSVSIPEDIAEQRFDNHEIQGLLSRCWKWIYEAGRVEKDCDLQLKRLEHSLSVAKAKHQLVASKGKEATGLSNADDRKAYVQTQPDILKLEEEIISAAGELAMSKLQKEKYENMFTALRKQASLIISEDELTRADKYRPSNPD